VRVGALLGGAGEGRLREPEGVSGVLLRAVRVSASSLPILFIFIKNIYKNKCKNKGYFSGIAVPRLRASGDGSGSKRGGRGDFGRRRSGRAGRREALFFALQNFNSYLSSPLSLSPLFLLSLSPS
jgi:hypothetical protein